MNLDKCKACHRNVTRERISPDTDSGRVVVCHWSGVDMYIEVRGGDVLDCPKEAKR